jgi:membrane protein insertase Oxa1/YidC/SpoIIIJ
VSVVDGQQLWGALAQLPIIGGLYSVIRDGLASGARFLWMADLGRPDLLLTLACAALSYGAAVVAPDLPRDKVAVMGAVSAVFTLVFLWRTAAAFGLYVAASSSVGLLQAVMLRREQRQT